MKPSHRASRRRGATIPEMAVMIGILGIVTAYGAGQLIPAAR